jgi:hypothetical protein
VKVSRWLKRYEKDIETRLLLIYQRILMNHEFSRIFFEKKFENKRQKSLDSYRWHISSFTVIKFQMNKIFLSILS